ERVHVAFLDEPARGVAVAVPEWAEQRAAVVHRAADLMAERGLRLLEAGSDAARARCGVDLVTLHARTEHCRARIHGRPDRVPRGGDLLGWLCLAFVEEVPAPLQVAAVLVLADPEVGVDKLAALRLELGRTGVADLLVRAGVHGGALAGLPRVAEAAPRHFVVEDRGDLRLL